MTPKKQGEFSPPDSPEDAAVKAHARQMPVDGLTGNPQRLIKEKFGGDEKLYIRAVRALYGCSDEKLLAPSISNKLWLYMAAPTKNPKGH